jgi:hypothetical protein
MAVAGPDTAPIKAGKPFSGRRRANRQILRFSISMGFAGALLASLVYMASAFPSILNYREANRQALYEITCAGITCDSSKYSIDWQWNAPDYVVDTQNRFFIDQASPTATAPARYPPLDYSDSAFIERFRQPATYNTPDGEVWRLCSQAVVVADGKSLEVIVGYALKAPWNAVQVPDSLIGDVDGALRREADKIAWSMSSAAAPIRPQHGFSADGFQVVDPKTNRVVQQGPSLPALLPKGVSLPTPGLEFYVYGGGLYAAQTDTDGRLLTTSIAQVGGFGWIICSFVLGFLCVSYLTNALSRRFLRNYFAVVFLTRGISRRSEGSPGARNCAQGPLGWVPDLLLDAGERGVGRDGPGLGGIDAGCVPRSDPCDEPLHADPTGGAHTVRRRV